MIIPESFAAHICAIVARVFGATGSVRIEPLREVSPWHCGVAVQFTHAGQQWDWHDTYTDEELSVFDFAVFETRMTSVLHSAERKSQGE